MRRQTPKGNGARRIFFRLHIMEPEWAEDLDAIGDATDAIDIHRRWAYYQGVHPKVYSTPKLAEIFRSLTDSLTENYCGIAVQARVDRLEIEGWTGDNGDAAQTLWDASKGPLRQDRLYRWALAHGNAWIVVDGEAEAVAFNPPTVAHAIPDPEADEIDTYRVGGKIWRTEQGRRAVLYYPEYTVRFAETSRNTWEQDGDETPQPLGVVPMVEVRPYGDGPAMLDLVAPIQDRINKIVANTLVAAEFGAFRQRVFFTRQTVDAYDLRQAPDHAIVLDPGDVDGQARMQETTASDLANYDNSKSQAVDAFFTIALLPRHLRVNPGSPPSGDAIKADEGPLVQAIREHQREVGEALMDAMTLLGVEDVEPAWRDPEVNDDKTNAETVAVLVGAGVPWQVAVKKAAGWTDADVAEAELVAAQAITTPSPVGTQLLQAFNTNPTPPA